MRERNRTGRVLVGLRGGGGRFSGPRLEKVKEKEMGTMMSKEGGTLEVPRNVTTRSRRGKECGLKGS